MTEPRTGPGSEPGQPGGPGQPGSGPAPGMGQDSGTAGPGASSTGVTTAARTTAAQASVPQQYGREPEYGSGMGGEAAMPAASAPGGMIAAAAGRAWPALLLGALGLIAVGIALLVWPSASLTVISILIGAAVLGSGIVRMYEGFTASNESGGMRAGYVVIGLLAVLAGLYLLRHHALSLFLVAFVTGVFFIAQGISELGVAISAHVPGRAFRGVLGVVSIAAGILMVVWPSITLVILFTLVAAWLLFYGLVLGGLAFGLRKAAKDAKKNPAESMTSARPLAASTR